MLSFVGSNERCFVIRDWTSCPFVAPSLELKITATSVARP